MSCFTRRGRLGWQRERRLLTLTWADEPGRCGRTTGSEAEDVFDGSRGCPDVLLALKVAKGPPTKAHRCPQKLEKARKWVVPGSFRKKRPAHVSFQAARR